MAVENVIKEQNLSPAVKNITKTTSPVHGRKAEGYSVIKNRASWAISYLRLTDYITNKNQRGFWEITKLGIENYPVKESDLKEKIKIINKEKLFNKKSKEVSMADIEEGTLSNTEIAVQYSPLVDENDWKVQILNKLQKMEFHEFEVFCGQFLKHIGFENVVVTQKAKDGGFDATASLRQNILSTRVLIECKKWQEGNNVGDEVVQKLRGVMKSKHVDKGIIFTTSDFTKGAYESSKSVGDIELINGDEICNLMKKNGFGVVIEMVPRVRMDERFIEGLIK